MVVWERDMDTKGLGLTQGNLRASSPFGGISLKVDAREAHERRRESERRGEESLLAG